MRHTRKYILFVLLVVPVLASYADVEVAILDGIQFAITENYTATVIRQKDLSGEILIPDTIYVEGMSFPVTCIDKMAFASCPSITHFDLPPTIETVYSSAFEGTAFYSNRKNWTQDGCLYIDDILIHVTPKKVKKQFEVSENTRVIASGAFSGCDKLRQITLPEDIESIPPEAFAKCANLETVNIPTSIRSIGENAFLGTALYRHQDNWENGILYVDHCAVGSNNSKKPQFLTFRKGTRILANCLLRMNTNVTHVVCLPSITHIGEQCFSNCRELVEIDCGGNIEHIGNQAFLGCEKLSNVRNIRAVNDSLLLYNAERNFPKSKQKTMFIGAAVFYNCHSLQDIELPEELACLREWTFYNCFALQNINLPTSLLVIEEGVFNGCTNLEKVIMPSSVIQIGRGCFFRCTKLSLIDMSSCTRLTAIPPFFAKRCTDLKKVRFPASIDYIGQEAFAEDTHLHKYTLPPNIYIESDAFHVVNEVNNEGEE